MDIQQADERAQVSFRACLEAWQRTGSWSTPEVDAYLNAEADLSWAIAKQEMDALIETDLRYDPELALGDHFAGMPGSPR